MKVLIVDDSKTVLFIMTRMMRQLGYSEIVEADSGEKAKEILQRDSIGLVLSDLNMPGTSGLDLLRWARGNSATAELPFVMVTTVHDKKIIMEAVKSGLHDYLLKPADKNVLYKKLSALSRSHGIQAPILHVSNTAAVKPVAAVARTPAPSTCGDKQEGSIPGTQAEVLTPECIEEITAHFFLVFDGELTMSDFRDWIAEQVASRLSADDATGMAGRLIEELRESAARGIGEMLAARNAATG